MSQVCIVTVTCIVVSACTHAQDAAEDPIVEEDIGKSRDGSRTDDEVVERCVHARLFTQQRSSTCNNFGQLKKKNSA